MPTPLPKPQGSVSFTMNDRLPRILIWLNENFLLLDKDSDPMLISPAQDDKDFVINFLLLRGGGSLILNFAVGGKSLLK